METGLSSGESVRRSSRSVARPEYFSEDLSISMPKRTALKRKRETKDHLYAVSVVERRSAERQVKVHYEGYSSQCDEWKDEDEVVPIPTPAPDSMPLPHHTLYNELASRIKLSLNCVRKQSVIVRIDMPFDLIQYQGGLKVHGYFARCHYKTERYKIHAYKDLNPLLGTNWHYRGINPNGDFCYVILDTVEYYLYRRQPLKEYIPGGEEPILEYREMGHMLVFQFVRGDGTRSEFGKDATIFDI